MKKFTAILMALIMIAALTACSSHSHTETGNWEVDAAEHWKVCGECGEKTQTGEHTLNDESKCTVCNSEIMDWGDSASVFTYDEHDNIVRTAEYDADGQLVSETVSEYAYDANGNLLKCKETVDGRLNSETEYTVSDGESIDAKYTQYNEDGSKFINEYDGNGNVIKLIDYDAEGNVTLQADSEYAQKSDGEWYEKSATETYTDGTKIETEYDEQHNATSRLVYDADGNVTTTEKWEYTYDESGLIAKEKEYADGTLCKEIAYKIVAEDDGVFSYPETVTTYNEDGSKTVCVYDENNEVISETTYDASGKVIA